MGNSNTWVDTQESLNDIAGQVSDTLAIDTEFHMRSTFFRLPCLLQLATEESVWIVDLLAPLNLKPIAELLQDRTILKVMFAAGEDRRLFAYLFGSVPNILIDIQLACNFLSKDSQLSYELVVNNYLGTGLYKKECITTSDWRHRPLSAEQLNYATDDVNYLLPLWREVSKGLRELGRDQWFYEEQRIRNSPRELTPCEMFQRTRGVNKLSDHDRFVFNELATWRESVIRKWNKPRGWVASDELLINAVIDPSELPGDPSNGRPSSTVSRLERMVVRARDDYRSGRRPFATESRSRVNGRRIRSRTIKSLQEVVREKSRELNIAQGVLGSNVDIRAWALHFLRTRELPTNFGNWRKRLIGDEIVSHLHRATG